MSKKTIPVNYEIPGYSDEINYEIFNNPIISTWRYIRLLCEEITHESRKRSKELLEEAKLKVEEMIEKGANWYEKYDQM